MRVHDFDLKLLRTFRAIVEAGGVVGAQLTLNVSQSTLSTQLADLEKRLGFRVCYRGRSGFALTTAGQQIYDACQDLFSAADRFQNTAASISGELRGVLRLGIVDAMITNRAWDLSAIIGEFNDRAKKTVIEVYTDSPGNMERLVIEGARDVTIAGAFTRKTTGIVYIPLFNEQHALFCSNEHVLAGREAVEIAELKRYAFVARRYLHRYDLERVGHVSSGAVVEEIESQALLIQSGRFIGYLPVHYGETIPSLTRVTTRESVEYYSPFYLLHKNNAEENLLIRNFINRVREAKILKSKEYPQSIQPLESVIRKKRR
ncbi:LysR family transcriptional regulator [Rhizobium lusitanum]|uniref:DNA-binding transcriptional LysR family regulator n=1 Tax=Rhizobium lusitanum TaxID=293958 RepID=A0A7X0MFE3_9HYPH|nr:LysR family transcriptional regulator [Rhizobium lusitanum]MBB6488902.1 DNA-binding transcriptional LysR family regulator [Rhizobium lusitanum]